MSLTSSAFNHFLKDLDQCVVATIKDALTEAGVVCLLHRHDGEEHAVQNGFNRGTNELEEELRVNYASYITQWCRDNNCHHPAGLTFRFTAYVFEMEKERYDDTAISMRAFTRNDIGQLYNLYSIWRGEEELASIAYDEIFQEWATNMDVEEIHAITILQSHVRRRQAHIALIRSYFE